MGNGKRGAAGGRSSTAAIEKRRVARQLNALFGGAASENGKLDGRTEKRKQRLLKELKEGRRGQALKPIEIITHADELLSLGETIATIRKNGVRVPPLERATREQREAARRAQEAYGFKPQVWKLLGVELDVAAPERRAGAAPRRTSSAKQRGARAPKSARTQGSRATD